MTETVSENLEGSRVSENVDVEQNEVSAVSELHNNGMESEQILPKEETRPDSLVLTNDSGIEDNHQIFSEEVQAALEVSASTGKFWKEWGKLKDILSYQIKKVLSEFPEAKMTVEEQMSSLGETFDELAKRLEDALQSFEEGPPFTLQRLCELLLSARSIYPKLSKFCLALEKSLLVTSTLTISSDSHQHLVNTESNGAYGPSANALAHTNSPPLENGQMHELGEGDRDEIMTEADDSPVADEDMAIENETAQEVVTPSEENHASTLGW